MVESRSLNGPLVTHIDSCTVFTWRMLRVPLPACSASWSWRSRRRRPKSSRSPWAARSAAVTGRCRGSNPRRRHCYPRHCWPRSCWRFWASKTLLSLVLLMFFWRRENYQLMVQSPCCCWCCMYTFFLPVCCSVLSVSKLAVCLQSTTAQTCTHRARKGGKLVGMEGGKKRGSQCALLLLPPVSCSLDSTVQYTGEVVKGEGGEWEGRKEGSNETGERRGRKKHVDFLQIHSEYNNDI